ncbi:MAG: MarR family transcriptional regulator [Anaerolineae bacterium]|jgi:MarR family 2-MHQ and catechol resistance regulon transcriptional repressor|nr:MAG: MarR family transcriptional regulator [Anaerolineae bacterium]
MPTHYHGTAEERRALNTFIKLMRAADSVEARLAQRGCLDDLTPSQFGVLETLYHLGSLCQTELAHKILKSSGNMTLVIDNLEKQGLVRRERDLNDRRFITVHLTEKGRQTIEAVLPCHVKAIVEEFSVLTPEEQETLGELCKKLGKGQSPKATLVSSTPLAEQE